MKAFSRLAAFAVLAVLSLLPVPASAKPAAAPPAAGPLLLLTRPAELTVGFSGTWRVETTRTATSADGAIQTQTDVQVFRLTVLAPRDGQTVLSYVTLTVEGNNDVGPAFVAVTQAHPVLFYANAAGLPTGLVDWPVQRAELAKAFRALGQDQVAGIIEAMDEREAIYALIPEVRILADMQSWPPMQGLRLDEPQRAAGDGDNAILINSWRELRPGEGAACRMGVYRFTGLDPASPATRTHGQVQRLETTGVLSLNDGWLISAEETDYRAREGRSERKVIKLTREAFKDDCATARTAP